MCHCIENKVCVFRDYPAAIIWMFAHVQHRHEPDITDADVYTVVQCSVRRILSEPESTRCFLPLILVVECTPGKNSLSCSNIGHRLSGRFQSESECVVSR